LTAPARLPTSVSVVSVVLTKPSSTNTTIAASDDLRRTRLLLPGLLRHRILRALAFNAMHRVSKYRSRAATDCSGSARGLPGLAAATEVVRHAVMDMIGGKPVHLPDLGAHAVDRSVSRVIEHQGSARSARSSAPCL
jgi:hypothetical protein